jgi:hypothetical protein
MIYYRYEPHLKSQSCQILRNLNKLTDTKIDLYKRAATFEDPESEVEMVNCSRSLSQALLSCCR